MSRHAGRPHALYECRKAQPYGKAQPASLASLDQLLAKCGELVFVTLPPRFGVEEQEHPKQPPAHQPAAHPARPKPTSAMRADLASSSLSNRSPVSVTLYGRRRSSAGRGSIRPAASSLERQPYRVPAPRRTPAKPCMSLINA